MNQTWENGKKTSFGPDFSPFDPNSGCQIFFFKKLAVSFTRCYGQLLSCTISEKTDDPILRKLSDGRTDRQTDKSDFIGRCPTNVERLIFIRRSIPKKLLKYLKRMNANN